jgi:hypothetical protein
MPDLTSSNSATDMTAELAQVVAAGQEIKNVRGDSFHVNLLALNSIAHVQRTGTVARGFAEVSRQMGRLSRDLDTAMNELWRLSARWVEAVSRLLQRDRLRRILDRALDEAGATAERAGGLAVRARIDERSAALRLDIRRARRLLLERLDDVDQLATMGCVISRAARIEAAYGGEFRPILGDLSEEFSGHAEHIFDALKALRKRLDEEHR